MAYIIVLFLIIGSAYAMFSVWDVEPEFSVPIVISFISIGIYIFGFFGYMHLGYVTITIFTLVLFVYGVYKSIKRTINPLDFFNINIIIYLIYIISISIRNYNLLASLWDEFTHWADSVKGTVQLDDFVANPKSNSLFKNYPPIMTLFQYWGQKINITLSGQFNEGLLYSSYLMFSGAVLLPVLSIDKKRSVIRSIIFAGIIFISPVIFYKQYFYSIYIDQFLGIIFGASITVLMFNDLENQETNISFSKLLYMNLMIANLVLAKDVGVYFAFVIAVILFVNEFSKKILNNISRIVLPLSGLCTLLISKWSWNIILKSYNLSTGGRNVNLINYIKYLLGRGQMSLEKEVALIYRGKWLRGFLDLSHIKINYLIFIVLLTVSLFLLYSLINKNKKNYYNLIIIVVSFYLYIFALGMLYVFLFSEYEAKNLASFDRYLSINLLGLTILLMVLTSMLISKINKKNIKILTISLVLSMTISVLPLSTIKNWINGSYQKSTETFREQFELLDNEINKLEDNKKIYYIHQGSSGITYHVMRFNVRPHNIYNAFGTWSIGEPFYEGDVWTKNYTATEWKDVLQNESYGYVAIYKINDYFRETYYEVFEDPNDIEENKVYKVLDNGLLQKIK